MSQAVRPNEHRFTDRGELTRALAGQIVQSLDAAVAARGAASFVVSGGTTPGPLFDLLSETRAPWDKVEVALADERWVEPDDPRSNERLVRSHLIRARAAAARFTPMKTPDPEPEAAEAKVSAALGALPRPFDVTLLGFGENGHTASLFPHGVGLKAALDLDDPALARAVRPVPPDDPLPPRMSMTLRALLDSHRIDLLFTGEAKWAAYEDALAGNDVEAAPARAVLRQHQTPVQVWWAP
ncbi:MAG TPA: 6-phosphogluconolactonase [Caulobacteraceae bacterium]|jgi:6-phosphogluconolactonase|nr:6-phosphogluconolactonase [Caulobacteraceae bacterium]